MLNEAQGGHGLAVAPEAVPSQGRFDAPLSYDEGEREMLHGQLSKGQPIDSW